MLLFGAVVSDAWKKTRPGKILGGSHLLSGFLIQQRTAVVARLQVAAVLIVHVRVKI